MYRPDDNSGYVRKSPFMEFAVVKNFLWLLNSITRKNCEALNMLG
jgi:hypothetical protein